MHHPPTPCLHYRRRGGAAAAFGGAGGELQAADEWLPWLAALLYSVLQLLVSSSALCMLLQGLRRIPIRCACAARWRFVQPARKCCALLLRWFVNTAVAVNRGWSAAAAMCCCCSIRPRILAPVEIPELFPPVLSPPPRPSHRSLSIPMHLLMLAVCSSRTADACAAGPLASPAAQRSMHQLYSWLHPMAFCALLPLSLLTPQDAAGECRAMLRFLQAFLGTVVPLAWQAIAESRLFAQHQVCVPGLWSGWAGFVHAVQSLPGKRCCEPLYMHGWCIRPANMPYGFGRHGPC